MVIVKEISAKKDIKRFIDFPNRLYRDNPYYVPDMFASQVADFDRSKNPAYEYCDSKCFLAFRDGRIVGRVAAILNTRANEKYGKQQLRFSHADYIDDDEVVDALFGAVENWARELGCTEVHGPLGFCDMDREGMLIEGFDRMSQFYVYYNHPYYITQMERMGYGKEADWIEYRLRFPDVPNERLTRLATAVERRMKLTHADLRNRADMRPYVKGVFDLYNAAYLKLFGVTALTPAQVEKYVKEFLPLVNARTVDILLDQKGEVVGFGIACPSLSLAQRRSQGRMFPFGWFHLLRAMKGKNTEMDLLLIAVHPEFRGAGLNAVILHHLLVNAIEDGRRFGETGPQLETNVDVQTQWRYFDAEQHKKRRCYVKVLE